MGFCLASISIWLLIVPPVGIIGILLGLFFMLIAPFAYKMLQCKDCNYSWRYLSKKHKKCGAPIEISKKKSQISTGRGCLIILVVVVGIIAAYVSSDQDSGSRPTTSAPIPSSATGIPADVTYLIIDSDTFLDYKRSLDIRLSKKVSEETLRAIALKLNAQDSKNYERTFICYYLPDMKVGAGAWATTHFNPNLDVRIQGLTAEQEETLKKQPDDPSREVIGSWLDESPFVGSRITIFRQNGKLFIENTYKDGSSGKKEIVEKLSGKDRTFREKERNSFGEFYLIDSQGNLQLWDQEGLISTAKKIDS